MTRIVIPDETLNYVIARYTREAGVRELERMLGRIVRKITAHFVKTEEQAAGTAERPAESAEPIGSRAGECVTVKVAALPSLLGPERFFLEKARQELNCGVAAGLAWTEAGGEVLFVESVLLPGAGSLLITGQLGDVMRESALAARSYVSSQAARLGLDISRIKKSGVHIHVPAGAVPKDGPSAGVTIAVALTSLYSGQPARSDTAMTGEVTLSGLVLPVGGIKEKLLAAHRAGLSRIILPLDNQKDLEDLPDSVRADLEFVFVKRLEDVLSAAIPDLAPRVKVTEMQVA